jgi:hypothetical protein
MALLTHRAEQEIDSTHFGNKTRFVNNSSRESANCESKNLLCNTVHRIGLYATKDIPPGTELFFHYGYAESQTKNFKEPGVNKSTKVVVVKTKATTTSSLLKTQQGSRARLSTPERRKQTEKARAARHTRNTEAQAATPDLTDPAIGQKRARKSILKAESMKRTRGTHRTDADISDGKYPKEMFNSIADSAVLVNMPSTQSSAPVESQELVTSDPEDVYVPDDEEDAAMDDCDQPVLDDDDVVGGSSGSLPVRIRRAMAPVVAVKRPGKRGGARPGAGRKRKKFPSEEEV